MNPVWTLYKCLIHLLLFVKHMQSHSRVGIEISVVDRFNQLLRYLDDLLFTSCRENKRQRDRQMVNGEKPVGRWEQLTMWWFWLDDIFSLLFQLLLFPSGSPQSVATARRSSLTSSLGPERLPNCCSTSSLSVALLLTFCTTQKLTKHYSLLCEHTLTPKQTPKQSASTQHRLSLRGKS